MVSVVMRCFESRISLLFVTKVKIKSYMRVRYVLFEVVYCSGTVFSRELLRKACVILRYQLYSGFFFSQTVIFERRIQTDYKSVKKIPVTSFMSLSKYA